MKRKSIYLVMTVTAALFITFSACKKDAAPVVDETTTESTVQAEDQANLSLEMDAVDNDVNAAIESDLMIGGRSTRLATICDASVAVDSTDTTRTITISYDGTTTCRTDRSRSGSITLSVARAAKWREPGTAVTITVTNLKVTRASDSKSITLNGNRVITNVSGGKIIEMTANSPTRTQTVTSDVTITFDNGPARTWHVANQRLFTLDGSNFMITITGMHEATGLAGISDWGTDRLGQEFSTQIVSPLVVSSACDWRLVSGKVKYNKAAFSITTTFGLDATGVATGCPATGGHFYRKTEWTNALSVSHTVIAPY
jgi:hypothetical protein